MMAERFYVADLAKASPVPAGGTLEEAVLHRLQARGVTEAEWDSWRRPDGSWLVVARFASDLSSVPQSEEIATWVFDPKRRRPRRRRHRPLAHRRGGCRAGRRGQCGDQLTGTRPIRRHGRRRHAEAAAAGARRRRESGTAGNMQDRPAASRSIQLPNGPTGRPLSRRAYPSSEREEAEFE